MNLQFKRTIGTIINLSYINTSMHNKLKSFKTGQPTSSLPHHEGLETEGNVSQQLSLLQLLFEDSNEQDEHVMDIRKSNSKLNSDEETSSGGTSRTSYNVIQTVHC